MVVIYECGYRQWHLLHVKSKAKILIGIDFLGYHVTPRSIDICCIEWGT